MSAEVIIAPALESPPPVDTMEAVAVAVEGVSTATAATVADADGHVASSINETAPIVTATTTSAAGEPATIVSGTQPPAMHVAAAPSQSDNVDSVTVLSVTPPVQVVAEPPAKDATTTEPINTEPITSAVTTTETTTTTKTPAATAVGAAVTGTPICELGDGKTAAASAASVTSDSEDMLESESGVVTTTSVSVQLCEGCMQVCVLDHLLEFVFLLFIFYRGQRCRLTRVHKEKN